MTDIQSQVDKFKQRTLNSIDGCTMGIDGITAVIVSDICNANLKGYERISDDAVLGLCSAIQELNSQIQELSDQAYSQLN